METIIETIIETIMKTMLIRTATRAVLARDFQSFFRSMSSAAAPRFDGKVAIVTASTDGIGYAVAERLGMDGAKVKQSSSLCCFNVVFQTASAHPRRYTNRDLYK